MAAVINQHPSVTTESSLGENAKMELAQKIEGQLMGRIAGIHLLEREDGILTINEDRTLRVLLKRESGTFWPSIIQDLPHIPTILSCTSSLVLRTDKSMNILSRTISTAFHSNANGIRTPVL
uniref:CS domain-containing protein n=1 Tax=Globodera pallida TaxID=36090 RepID=A0A183CCB5_GLOPA